MGKLVLFLADGSTLDIPLSREKVTIGRRADNDVCLPYPAVSGEHATVVTILSDSFLEDVGSTNGTLVNGRPIAKHFLRDRDQIDIGRQKLIFVADETVQLEPSFKAYITHQRVIGEQVEQVRPKSDPAGKANERSPASSETIADLDRFVAAEIGAKPPGTTAETPAPPASGKEDVPIAADDVFLPAIRILTGANAGRTIALAKEGTSVGRAGVQVAIVSRDVNGVRITPIEGDHPPLLNGTPVPVEGAGLDHGDVIELAGVQLEFVGGVAGPNR